MQVLFCYGYQWICDYEESCTGDKPASRRQQLFERFLDLVQRHYAGQRGISFYAGKMCVTPKYLSAVVRRAGGRFAGDWIRERVVLGGEGALADKAVYSPTGQRHARLRQRLVFRQKVKR